jgi:hypothetical protein
MSRFINKLFSDKGGGAENYSNTGDIFKSPGGQYQFQHHPNSGANWLTGQKPSNPYAKQDKGLHITDGRYASLCRSLLFRVIANDSGKKMVAELGRDEAQYIVDFLNEVSAIYGQICG